ncbi:MAG: hypothetical protein L3J12_04690, partial [Spirochaetales bacterium]|nr:hypothetical protein [Spirochaetales bacterium]
MRIIVFHYHFLPGGVTQVVKLSAAASIRYNPSIEGITLVSGNRRNLTELASEIEHCLKELGIENTDIDTAVLPEIDYLSNLERYPDPGVIASALENNFAGDLWWIHNYHIGKNPFFTEALLRTAAERPEQKMVFQIHDFPEEARYSNLEQIRKYLNSPLYPAASNIKYVTINSRDREYLTNAGIPKSMVFLLNNPVEEPKPRATDEESEKNRKKINKILTNTSRSFINDAPFMVYPVRAIRRKNILEAGLITKCSRVPVNLLVTLPGVSKTEKEYSSLVDDCFREKLIPGSSGIGSIAEKNQISFLEIINSGSLVISSSLQEGFGYLFINSLQWEKPLLARNLRILDDFREIFQTNEHYFYERIMIPLDSHKRKILKTKYREKIKKLKTYLGFTITEKLSESVDFMLKQEAIDFSYLSPLLQRDFLRDISDPELLKTTQKLNSTILKNLENLLTTEGIYYNNSSIKKFSLQTHSKQIEKVILSFNDPEKVKNQPSADIEQKLLSSFTGISSVRL